MHFDHQQEAFFCKNFNCFHNLIVATEFGNIEFHDASRKRKTLFDHQASVGNRRETSTAKSIGQCNLVPL